MGSTVEASKKTLRIGVDVGGTNTDGVVLDPLRASEPDKGILAWHKAPTTTNPSLGINDAITTMFQTAGIRPDQIASVTIGTTHFVNAVVERDAARLSRVAVLRLCGPFSKHAPPCIDWPADMRELVLGHYALLKGGLEVDGSLISDIDEAEIRAQCAVIREKGIRSVVVNGVFSPIDTVEHQEERAAAIVRAEIPGCDVVCSKEVANLGFLERENAAILNASILAFARKTIRSFQEPIKRLGLDCPVFITQNDGTILSGDMAARLPIRTFSSGPTNSMRGAAFLVHGEQSEVNEAIMVVDVGGTTTDVGLLLANGFPRQQAAYSDLAGVRMNFSCPDVKSIGLGGGSIVRNGETLTVGPDSVGYKITEKSLVFGGDVLTTTDMTVLAGNADIGNKDLVKGAVDAEGIAKYKAVVKHKIEKIIDTMKTSPEDLPVLLVGGGAVIAPDELVGATHVLKPKFASIANAIGAAVARVSAVVDTVKSTESKTTQQILEEICQDAIERAVANGASRPTTKVVEMDILPLPYIANKSRFTVRAAGDLDYSRTDFATLHFEDSSEAEVQMDEYEKTTHRTEKKAEPQPKEDVDIDSYRPTVRDRVWYINETDLDWITIGCYILGTGGGGSPYAYSLRLREMLRRGDVVRVVNPDDLADDAAVATAGHAGSPTVGIEKLGGDEMMEAQVELAKVSNVKPTHIISIEIGGGNGLQSMIVGASSNMDLPAMDCDWMGRAYPTKWQTTPVVFNERSPVWAPIAMTDGNGNVVIMPTATSDLQVERITRAALSAMGSSVGCAEQPVSGAECKRWAVEHTISQSWRIGRAVVKARKSNCVDHVAETILEECGGPEAGQVLWKGKIVGVHRTLRNGHVYGECVIEGADVVDDDAVDKRQPSGASARQPQFQGRIKIPFKNENIAAIKISQSIVDGKAVETEGEVLGLVPDLISVIDAQNGEAIGTPEYRYGLLVIVLGITASERWTSERGIEIGGPKGFNMDHLTYKPLGKFVKPVSVIDEFNVST
ncbi:DUF917-domain-containing protein [Hypoxylon cercidicola]|nr:DUF917-domain-containing protein [Hypoxylon cercidicola]